MLFRALTLVALVLVSPALAQTRSTIPVDITRPSTVAPLEDGNIYSVDVNCNRLKPLVSAASRWLSGTTASFFLLISSEAPTKTPTADQLPASALGMIHVFTVDSKTQFDNRQCHQSFFVSGGRPVYLVPIVSYSKTYDQSKLSLLVGGVLKLVSPLYSLFTGAALPTAASALLGRVEATQDPVKQLLATFNSELNFTEVTDAGVGGDYIIYTDYSSVIVRVRPIESLVKDGNTSFRADFRKRISEAPDKVSATDIAGSCRQVAAALAPIGFSTEDIAYALFSLAAHAGFDKYKAMTCLDRQYSLAAIELVDGI